MAAAQLGITICSLGLGAVGEPAIAHLMEPVFEARRRARGRSCTRSRSSSRMTIVVVPARRARRDGAQEPRAGRARPGRAVPRPVHAGRRRWCSSRSWCCSTAIANADRAAVPRRASRRGRRRPTRTTRSPGWSRSRAVRVCSTRTSTAWCRVRSTSHDGTVDQVLLPARRPGHDHPERHAGRRRAGLRRDRLLAVPGDRRRRRPRRLPAHQGRAGDRRGVPARDDRRQVGATAGDGGRRLRASTRRCGRCRPRGSHMARVADDRPAPCSASSCSRTCSRSSSARSASRSDRSARSGGEGPVAVVALPDAS